MVNIFQQAALDMIDDHFEWLRDSELAKESRNTMPTLMFANDMQTLAINGYRRAGYSSLINKLAFSISDPVGRKYSTMVIAPTHDIARYNYGPQNLYIDPKIDELANEVDQQYCMEWRDKLAGSDGKVIPMSTFARPGWCSRIYLNRQREKINRLTGLEIEKFDLCLIDRSNMNRMFTQEAMDYMYMSLLNDVELFVIFQ